ncbi:hypothetical protein BGZ82_006914 [Podila clonocystis]|nr:hypothetical protein BGZ82_006914 [Podila clonocystis]
MSPNASLGPTSQGQYLMTKGFENVSVIQAPLLGRCLIEGMNVDNGNDYTVLPVLVTETWSLEKMQDVFSSLDKEQDLRLQTAASSK